MKDDSPKKGQDLAPLTEQAMKDLLERGHGPKIRYVRSPSFKIVHCDGGVGAATNQGYLGLGLYSEYQAPPSEVGFEYDPERQAVREAAPSHPVMIIRELEVQVLFDVKAARGVSNWLKQWADIVEERQRESSKSD